MNIGRIGALLWKEWAELRRMPGAFLPLILLSGLSLAMPFIIAIVVPEISGEPISESEDFTEAIELATRHIPGMAALGKEAAVQAFIFQQFLLMMTLIPVTGGMALASYSVVGEKQGRSLEPLLSTPITTFELLSAKVLAAALPSLAAELATLVIYILGIAWLAEPGVAAAVLNARTLLIMLVLGPLAGLVALQLAVAVSSRVNDPRSAQQIGVLVILPLVGVMIAQFAGAFWLTIPLILLAAVVLGAIWTLLLMLGVALFERERILTRIN